MRRKSNHTIESMEKYISKPLNWRLLLLFLLSSLLWLLLFYLHPLPPPPPPPAAPSSPASGGADIHVGSKHRPCDGRYIYVHDLPPRFNEDMLTQCGTLSRWTNMCKFMDNLGLGPSLDDHEGVFSPTAWYATNQFAVDVIFNKRMMQYRCLTKDPSAAVAVFVPFYAGLEVSRHLWGANTSTRDASSIDLLRWLVRRPEWAAMAGRDHFLVAGRIAWDFLRLSESDSDWGSRLLLLPAARNMTMLVVESSPWNSNDFGIPYPTYFHPGRDEEVVMWQARMRSLRRGRLFAFAGAPRPGNSKDIRGRIMEECRRSQRCGLLECDGGESKCHSPHTIMRLFQTSIFCLQPQGDSYTRRSSFDSFLAGCIPVFFHPGSAYTQYTWHLPRDHSLYSVFIPEDQVRRRNMTIEETLRGIPLERVRAMREEVVRLIPRLIYADPRSRLESFQDAFDVAVDAVVRKVTRLREETARGGRGHVDVAEENSWKYALLEDREAAAAPHEWDPFFTKPKRGSSS